MRRRKFLKAGVAAVSLHAFPYCLFADEKKKYASDPILLGPRKIELSRMAVGTGTGGWGGSSNQTRKLGIRGLADLLRHAVDEGINFWDSADQYGSHPHLKEALKSVPREKVVILTKTHALTETDMTSDLDRFRREIGTDYLDIVLFHSMSSGDWPRRQKGAMAVLAQAREEGIVRTHGFSCHSLAAMNAGIKTPWAEVILTRLNPGGVLMDGDVPTVTAALKKMKAAGKGIIGMKVLGRGRLPGREDECLEFALGRGILDCFTIGSESVEQFDDLVKRIPAASVRG